MTEHLTHCLESRRRPNGPWQFGLLALTLDEATALAEVSRKRNPRREVRIVTTPEHWTISASEHRDAARRAKKVTP